VARRGLDRLRDRKPTAVDLAAIGDRIKPKRLTDEERDQFIDDLIRQAKTRRTANALGKLLGKGINALAERYGA